ncbi:jg7397 [Pararge aegeria aegeria]|uniref:Jg7397 protein n=1 Tax=Pararge aegeria aegeria TaxID=348720 RepID=A0A8S4RSD6_9NEOP|nr:jg7397 [Pararge aegeria aegeria]
MTGRGDMGMYCLSLDDSEDISTVTNDNRHTNEGFVFGHLQRGSLFEFPRLILEGKINGKRAPGRPRKKWFDDIREWNGHTKSELKKMAHHRSIFHRLISKLQYEDDDDDEQIYTHSQM